MTSEAADRLILIMNALPEHDAASEHSASQTRLVALAQAGDTKAFEQLIIFSERRVAATAWRFLGNREDARDAVQEVFLRAYKYLRSFKVDQDFNGWLYRITVNVCRDQLRARSSSYSTAKHQTQDELCLKERLEKLPSRDNTEEEALRTEQMSIVSRALEILSEKERTAIVLRDLEGHTTEEVARLMKTRPATVRSQISTARTKIKTFYERLLREKRTQGMSR